MLFWRVVPDAMDDCVVRYPHSYSADALVHKSKHMHWLPLVL